MKHKYTWLLLACITGVANAQQISRAQLPKWTAPSKFEKQQLPIKPGTGGLEKAANDIVFSDDFANGLAGNNQLSAPWTVGGPDGAIWRYSTTGPLGGYSTNAQKITSTSNANGFMIFDCDRSNSDTTVTPPAPLPQAQFQSRDGYLVSPLMDLTATPFVHLEYEIRARWCCSTFPVIFVDVSTDGGATWPSRIQGVQNNLFANDDPGTYTMYVNLHNAIIANPANVKFRFAWEGSSQTNGMSHYFLQVDDVKVLESENNNVTMLNPAFNAYLPGTVTNTAEFDISPLGQQHELVMGSPVTNEGSNAATSVNMNYVVKRDGSEVFNTDVLNPSIAQDALDSGFFAPYTPDAVGNYTLDLNLTMDSVDARPAANTASKAWRVDDFVYAQDEGARDGVIQNLDAANDPQEYFSCNFFWLENDATVYAIQVALASGSGNSQVGGEFDCTVLDPDLAELGTTNLFGITATNQLSGNGQARMQTVMFEPPLELTGQQEVCTCLHYYGGGQRVTTASSGASLLGQSLFMTANATGSRFIELQAPMVRMNFNPSVGIEEGDRQNGVGLGQNFPNPANNITYIPYDLAAAASVTIEVFDMSGKLITSQVEGKRAPGSYRAALNTNALNEGVYFYTLTAGGVRMSKRMTVLR